jgi:hypothetical protein
LAPFLRKSQARMAPIARFEKGFYFGARAGLQVKHMLGGPLRRTVFVFHIQLNSFTCNLLNICQIAIMRISHENEKHCTLWTNM